MNVTEQTIATPVWVSAAITLEDILALAKQGILEMDEHVQVGIIASKDTSETGYKESIFFLHLNLSQPVKQKNINLRAFYFTSDRSSIFKPKFLNKFCNVLHILNYKSLLLIMVFRCG